jgi:hypothetical protein
METEPHKVLIAGGEAYSLSGRNAGLAANLRFPWHYPVWAVCSVCGLVVRREKMAPEQLDWMHMDPEPGDSL